MAVTPPGAKYTRAVMDLAKGIRGLSIGEMLALKETLKGDFDLPPDAGVREPVQPSGPSPLQASEQPED
jgi:hypothetical protein